MTAAALMLLLPDFVVEPRRRERESEEQRPLFCPGSDPAAERQESNYYTARPQENKRWKIQCAGHSLTLQQLNEKTSWTFLLSAFQESPPSTSRLIQTDEGRTCSGRSPAGPGKRRVLGW